MPSGCNGSHLRILAGQCGKARNWTRFFKPLYNIFHKPVASASESKQEGERGGKKKRNEEDTEQDSSKSYKWKIQITLSSAMMIFQESAPELFTLKSLLVP